jgi:hypothetical protein
MDNEKIPKISPYYCEICDIDCHKKNKFEQHVLTSKHKKRGNFPQNDNQNFPHFKCSSCGTETNNKKDFERHLLTAKHKNDNDDNLGDFSPQQNSFACKNCGKKYKFSSGLCRHKQLCKEVKEIKEVNEVNKVNEVNVKNNMEIVPTKYSMISPEIMTMVVKEIQKVLIEQNKAILETVIAEQNKTILEVVKMSGTNNSHNTINNNNSHNSFNMNFFLNETCKNAMNLSDFVNGVDISLEDLEETGRIGYVEGLSRIFCKELQKLDISERPIHCSDVKRETIYIRENNRWEKDENKERLLRAVKQIGKKNIKVLTLWQEKYPGYKDVESKENDRYLQILTNIMCGETEEEIQSNYGKIMKNISRITMVDKSK